MFCNFFYHNDVTSGSDKGHVLKLINPGPLSAFCSVSDCRSRGREFDPGPVPYFRGH